ncbi:MAG: type-F conjugative transfer system secretin TraK, partial [Nitrosopumilus sp.]
MGLILPFFNLEATRIWSINQMKILTVVFSSEHHNRIIVEGGRVAKIIFPKGYLDVEIEQVCGNVYISSNNITPQNVTVSLITENGYCQDIQISFSNKPSEIFVLSEKEGSGITPSTNKGDEVGKVVKALINGCVPEGYYFRDTSKKNISSSKGLCKQFVSLLEGSRDRIYIFKITNTKKCLREIEEIEFVNPGTKWV